MDKTIISTPTQELYNKIVDKFGWCNGEKHKNYWEIYKEKICLRIENDKIYTCDKLDAYKKYCPNYTFLTAEEVLGESPETQIIDLLIEEQQKIFDNYMNKSSNEQKGHKPMNLIGKLKQIAKSKEQKRVDKYLMIGENGFNTDGVNIILSTLMEDKEFAKKIDEKLAKIEKAEEKKK